MKWTKDKLDLFFAMKEEGCSIEEICNALGCERQAVYDKTKSLIKMNGGRMPKYNVKSDDKGDKDMSKYPPKRVKVDAAEVWRMLDEGKTRREIAEHFGVSLQTICNRITAGRPKAEKQTAEDANFEAIIESVDAGSVSEKETVPETSAETSVGTDVLGGPVRQIEEPTEAHNVEPSKWRDLPIKDDGPAAIDEKYEESGDTEMMKNTEDAIMNTFLGGKVVETSADERTSAEKPGAYVDATEPDIIDLAFQAKRMAFDAGFTPNHMMLDMQKERSEIIVSGEGEDGKVYEIEFSVTDPMYFLK